MYVCIGLVQAALLFQHSRRFFLSLFVSLSCTCVRIDLVHEGSLATAGFGTALGVIRALSEKGLLEACFCTETRPYNQVYTAHTRVVD